MTGVSHEVKVKLALLQILEVLRSSTKDHGASLIGSSLEIQKHW